MEKVEFCTLPRVMVAVQFTGKNSKEIAEWITSNNCYARAGGSYVDLFNQTHDIQERLRKNDWVFHSGLAADFFCVADNEIAQYFERVV